MVVTKRDGRIVPFNKHKIINAIEAAGGNNLLAEKIAEVIESAEKDYNVEEIQNIVERKLMNSSSKDVALNFIRYRERRTMARGNTIDKTIEGIINVNDPYWSKENSNKDEHLALTQRDYIAGAVSTDVSRRCLLPDDVIEAHDEGKIHFHDIDYFIQRIHNCCLVDMEDMLENGTVINKTKIERPHSFLTACTIATQVASAIASSQFGGQTFSISAVSRFLKESRKTIEKNMTEDFGSAPEHLVQKALDREIEKGVQLLQYQINTLYSTNGQAPFLSIALNLAEAKDKEELDYLVRVIEEILKQRIKGVKNEFGAWIAPTFPKLLYFLDENNAEPNSEYYWLTKLAAECVTKRMVPDFISSKVMKEVKGDVFPCINCPPVQVKSI